MGQNSSDIEFLSIVVNGRNQPDFVSTDIKYSQIVNAIGY